MSEVLPIPFGPTIAMRAPLATLNDTPLKISVGPYDFESELTVMSDMVPSFFDLNAPYYTRTRPHPAARAEVFILQLRKYNYRAAHH